MLFLFLLFLFDLSLGFFSVLLLLNDILHSVPVISSRLSSSLNDDGLFSGRLFRFSRFSGFSGFSRFSRFSGLLVSVAVTESVIGVVTRANESLVRLLVGDLVSRLFNDLTSRQVKTFFFLSSTFDVLLNTFFSGLTVFSALGEGLLGVSLVLEVLHSLELGSVTISTHFVPAAGRVGFNAFVQSHGEFLVQDRLGRNLDEVDGIVVVVEVQVEHAFLGGNLFDLHVEFRISTLDFLPGGFRVNFEDVNDDSLFIGCLDLVNDLPL